jgi:hypothetical protein
MMMPLLYHQKNIKRMTKLLSAFIFILVLTLFSVSTVFAVPKKAPQQIKPDSSKVNVKKFDAKAIEKLKAQKDFNYDGESTGEPSLWDIFWQWLWNTIAKIFNSVPYGGKILKYLLIALSIAFLVYVILKSLGIDTIRLLRGDAKKVDIAYSESLENIHEINFDSEIEKAIANLNYRLAIRLLYLKCLKQLSDKNLIQWQIDKTNSAYVHELANPQQKQTFGLLTRQFEYVWYGDFTIDKNAFGNINLLFQNFNKQL